MTEQRSRPDEHGTDQPAPEPDWMTRLRGGLDEVPPEWFSRFLPGATGARQAAVLMLFGPSADGGQDVVLTERPHTMRSHPGQVAFPGGSVDPGDADAADAALREANEEIGLAREGVVVVAQLPALHIPVSLFDVTPVLGWWSRPGPVWAREPAEVARVVRAPLSVLTDPEHRFQVRHPSGYIGPAFDVDGLLVWGFTAGLLAKTLQLAGLERPWDPARVRDLS